ncbi:unnamed protein product [Ixodes pacificus]
MRRSLFCASVPLAIEATVRTVKCPLRRTSVKILLSHHGFALLQLTMHHEIKKRPEQAHIANISCFLGVVQYFDKVIIKKIMAKATPHTSSTPKYRKGKNGYYRWVRQSKSHELVLSTMDPSTLSRQGLVIELSWHQPCGTR